MGNMLKKVHKKLSLLFLSTVLMLSVFSGNVSAAVTYSHTIGAGMFNLAQDVAVDSNGDVYVSDFGNKIIREFSIDGTHIRDIGAGSLNYVHGITIDSNDNIIATNYWGGQVVIFNPGGSVIGTISGFSYPADVAVDGSGNLFVADSNRWHVKKYDASYNFIKSFGNIPSPDGPLRVAVDNSDNVYVSDSPNHRIQKFTNSGDFITAFGSYGTGNGQFNRPWGTAIASDGTLYITDFNNNRVQVLDSGGNFLETIGGFSGPSGVVIGKNGEIIIADTYNNQVKVFTQGAPPPTTTPAPTTTAPPTTTPSPTTTAPPTTTPAPTTTAPPTSTPSPTTTPAPQTTLPPQTTAPYKYQTPSPPTTGTLSLSSSPSGADVYLNGLHKGTTPYVNLEMQEGAYSVKLSKEDYEDYAMVIRISPGSDTVTSATLAKKQEITGTISVESNPSAIVYLDDIEKGISPLDIPGVSLKSHVIRISKEGYRDYKSTIDVSSSGTYTVKADLTPDLLGIINDEVSIHLYSTGDVISIGESTGIIFSGDSYITNEEDMTLQTILKIPSGLVVTGAFADKGGGRYEAFEVIKPGEGTEISADLVPTNPGEYNIEGEVVYYFGDDKSTGDIVRINVPLKVTDSKTDEGEETEENEGPKSACGPTIISMLSIVPLSIAWKLRRGFKVLRFIK
jgi:sugar lactone lactonase YvrE